MSPVHRDESAWHGRPYSNAFPCPFSLFALSIEVGSGSRDEFRVRSSGLWGLNFTRMSMEEWAIEVFHVKRTDPVVPEYSVRDIRMCRRYCQFRGDSGACLPLLGF